MKCVKFSRPCLVVIAVLVINLAGLAGCTTGNTESTSGNTESTSVSTEPGTPPAFEFDFPGPPPIEVNLDQLYEDYVTNAAAADAKYKGKLLAFFDVEVTEIYALIADSSIPPIIYPRYNSVEFRPRYNSATEIAREGFVMDIVGEIQGIYGLGTKTLIVSDCWIGITYAEGIEMDLEDFY